MNRAGGFEVGSVYYTVDVNTAPLLAASSKVDREGQRMAARFNVITSAIAAMSSALFLVAQSDAFTKINAQLKLATDNAQAQANAFDRVRRIAAESQTDLGGVATLYARISQSSDELRGNQERVAEITRVVALALKVSGAGAAESASATLQLSQAFAAGALRGEEFNSVSEAAPRLMRALADGIGVPVGQLRAMAAEGKLTADVLSNALPQALSQLESEAQQIQTISGAFQVLRNELTIFIGQQGEATGAARLVAGAISTIAANIDVLAAAVTGFAATKLAQILLSVSATAAAQANQALSAGVAAAAEVRLAQAQVAATAAALAEAQAQRTLGLTHVQTAALATAHQAAVTRLAAAQTAAAGAASIASRALGLLGGPIGLITTLLGLGVTAWALWGSQAENSSDRAAGATKRTTDEVIASLERTNEKLRERIRLARAAGIELAKGESEEVQELAALQKQIDNLQAGRGPAGEENFPEAARVALLQELLKKYAGVADGIRTNKRLNEEWNAIGQESAANRWLAKYATDAERLAAELKKAREELGPAFTPELEQRIRQKFTTDKPPATGGAARETEAEIRARQDLARLARVDAAEQLADQEARAAAAREAQEAERAAIERQRNLSGALNTIAAEDPVERVKREAELKSQALLNAAMLDLENAKTYSDAMVAVEREKARRIADIDQQRLDQQAANNQLSISLIGDLASQAFSVLQRAGKEQSSLAKALFLAERAIAVATIIMNTEVAASKAQAQLGVFGIPMSTLIRATGYASAGLVAGQALGQSFGGGRQYGGPVSAGSMYRVNETGQPEMFVGSGGRQYMMPNTSGQVVPADELGGGGGVQVVVNNYTGARVDVQQSSDGRMIEIAVGRAKAEIASEFRENSGPVFSALTGSTNVRPRM